MIGQMICYSAFASYGATGLLSAIWYSGDAQIASLVPSLDVYGSYFPAWLICLIVGVILTVIVSQIGRLLDLSALRKFGPLIPVSLILIFSVATWFLFFVS
jgi:YtcA family